MDSSDDELWRRCAADDAGAMAELYRRHARAIYRHAFRVTADWSRAEDIAAEVFLTAWRGRTREIAPGMVAAWLHGLTVNVLRNEERGWRRRLGRIRRIQGLEPACCFMDEEAVAARLDDAQRARDLLELIRAWPRVEREVVALCWWSDLTYEEAAEALAIPVGTVRSRLARARRRLSDAGVDRTTEAVGEER